MIKKETLAKVGHKKTFAILFWCLLSIMLLNTYVWSLFKPVGDPNMIDKVMWTLCAAASFLTSADTYIKYKRFRKDAKDNLE